MGANKPQSWTELVRQALEYGFEVRVRKGQDGPKIGAQHTRAPTDADRVTVTQWVYLEPDFSQSELLEAGRRALRELYKQMQRET